MACVHGSTNGTNDIPISFKVLPMVPLVIPLVPMVMSMVRLALPMVPFVGQWYHWENKLRDVHYDQCVSQNMACVHGSTNGTNGIPISFKVLSMVPSPNGTIGKPMVPLATKGTIGKIPNGSIGRTPNKPMDNRDR